MAKFHEEKEKVTVGNGTVTINALTGNAQSGYIEAYLWPQLLVSGKESVNALAGTGNNLKGKMVRVEALAKDVNVSSDTVVLYVIIKEDGKDVFRKPYSETTADGETVMFDIQIQLQ